MPLHAEMTSGQPAVIRGLAADTTEAMTLVRQSIELIRYAHDRPTWDSDSARQAYNMRAWATRASSEICFNRLNRVTVALEMAADGYDLMKATADRRIDQFRHDKQLAVDALGMWWVVLSALTDLLATRDQYSAVLKAAQDFIDADPYSATEQDWQQLGLVKSMLRDLEHGTMPGPVIPDTFAAGQDDRAWTPQGLGLDQDGNLIQTGYEEVEGSDGLSKYLATLAVVDPDTGAMLNVVELGALTEGGDPPNHAGGVVVHEGTVWVSDSAGENSTMVPYSLSEIRGSTPASVVRPIGESVPVGAGASATVSGDTLYVGTFNEHGPGVMYTLTWDAAQGTWGDRSGPYEIPAQTQGIAVRGNEVVFSTSYGRDATGRLESYNLNDVVRGGGLPDPIRTVDLPTMAEGVTMLPTGVLTTYESGASPYSYPKGGKAEDLWASTFMSITPFNELGLSGDVEVVPTTLLSASSWFAEAETGLDKAARRVARLNLPPSSPGAVPGAGELVTASDSHLSDTANWLEEARLSSYTTTSGLIAAANDYEEADSRSDGLFGFLRRFVP